MHPPIASRVMWSITASQLCWISDEVVLKACNNNNRFKIQWQYQLCWICDDVVIYIEGLQISAAGMSISAKAAS